jgi:hypothetical protein
MLRRYKTKEKKDLMKIIRIMMDCALYQGKVVKIILCNKVDHLMFEFFAELLIKIFVYHKIEKLKVESCSFRNGKCYFIKVNAKERFFSNRSFSIKEKELFIVREFGLEYHETINTFNIIFNIPRKINERINKNLSKTKDQWWLKSYFEFILDQPRIGRINIKKGINRIEVNETKLKDENLIPTAIQI